MIEPLYYEFHRALAAHCTPRNALEIGFGAGESARAFLEGTEGTKSRLTSVDVNPACSLTHPRFTFVHGESPQIINLMAAQFDYIYIDGDKRSMHVYWDAYAAARILAPGGLIFFDDCENAWKDAVQSGIKRFLTDEPLEEVFFPDLPSNPHGSRFFRRKK